MAGTHQVVLRFLHHTYLPKIISITGQDVWYQNHPSNGGFVKLTRKGLKVIVNSYGFSLNELTSLVTILKKFLPSWTEARFVMAGPASPVAVRFDGNGKVILDNNQNNLNNWFWGTGYYIL